MKTILIAVDPIRINLPVVEQGILLGERFREQVEIVAVIDNEIDMASAATGMIPEHKFEDEIADTIEKIKVIVNTYRYKNIDIKVYLGNPKVDILSQLETGEYSHIVIGTHGRSAISQLLLGGTAEYLVRHSTIPVLVVPFNTKKH